MLDATAGRTNAVCGRMNAVCGRASQTRVSAPCGLFLVGGDSVLLDCELPGVHIGLSMVGGAREVATGRVTWSVWRETPKRGEPVSCNT